MFSTNNKYKLGQKDLSMPLRLRVNQTRKLIFYTKHITVKLFFIKIIMIYMNLISFRRYVRELPKITLVESLCFVEQI